MSDERRLTAVPDLPRPVVGDAPATYPHDCDHPARMHLGPEGVCQERGCMCSAADYRGDER